MRGSTVSWQAVALATALVALLVGTAAEAASPDLKITKTHVGSFGRGQSGAAYTLTVSNVGTGTATGSTVSVVDTLPAGLVLSPPGLNPWGGPGWLCAFASLTCTRLFNDDLAPGASYPPITLLVDVAFSAPPSVTNTATVSVVGDPNPANNTANDPTTIVAADLTVTKTHVGNFYRGQLGAQYTITVQNIGGGVSDGTVSVVDTLPAGLSLAAPPNQQFGGTGWLCSFGALTCTRLAGDTLAPGASYPPITLLVDVALNAPTTVTNSVTISGGDDGNGANNTATDPTTILAADLTVTKTHVGNFARGQVAAAYTIIVSNSGGVSDGTVSVVDTLPAGLTLSAPGLGPLGGPGWLCFFATLTCTRLAIDPLFPGMAYPPITLLVDVAANAPPTVTNSVTISGGGDSNAANNTATDLTLVAGTPALTGVASRRIHGAAGTFDLALTMAPPVNHNPTTEPRSGPAQSIVFTFDRNVTSGTASVTEGVATAGAPTFAGNEMTVPLTNVNDKQYVTVDVSNVASSDGGTGGAGNIRIGFLAGNVTQSRKVLPSDVGLVRSHLLQPVGPANFVYSVTLGSQVAPADVGLTRSKQLNTLPTP